MIERPLDYDYWEQDLSVLGMDEAGRGPIAGPLCVAGVIFPKGYSNNLIDDSKKLSEKKREKLAAIIRNDAVAYQILFISEEEIDKKNIYRATQQAMEAIADHLQADQILTDAMPLPEHPQACSIIKGDAKSLSIAAASILAKVSRDHYMYRLDQKYPQYGLAKHKGYPTRQHLDAIEKYGVKECYRKSYSPVARILDKEAQLSLF